MITKEETTNMERLSQIPSEDVSIDENGCVVVKLPAQDGVYACGWLLGPPASEMWYWALRFVRLSSSKSCDLESIGHVNYVKVLRGSVEGIPDLTPLRPPFCVRNTLFQGHTLVAGPKGLLALVLTASSSCPQAIHSPEQLTFTPMGSKSIPIGADPLVWRHVKDAFPAWGGAFDGRRFHHSGVISVWEGGVKVCYVRMWAAGIGVDCGIHDHSDLSRDTTFCEVHFALHSAGGNGGMVWFSSYNGAEHQVPLCHPGDEHGRFWLVEGSGDTELPRLRSNGGVEYVRHKWDSGTGTGTAMDVWIAIEFMPSFLYGN